MILSLLAQQVAAIESASPPWWLAYVVTPVSASIAAAAAYIWKQREKTQSEERKAAADLAKEQRDAATARVVFLETALRESEASRHREHDAHRDKLIELYKGAVDSEGDLREAVRSVTDLPKIIRDGIDTMTSSVRMALREELDRISVAPPTPRGGRK